MSEEANWEEVAREQRRTTNLYRSLLTECAGYLGPEIYACLDGSTSTTPLLDKVPALVKKLTVKLKRYQDFMGELAKDGIIT